MSKLAEALGFGSAPASGTVIPPSGPYREPKKAFPSAPPAGTSARTKLEGTGIFDARPGPAVAAPPPRPAVPSRPATPEAVVAKAAVASSPAGAPVSVPESRPAAAVASATAVIPAGSFLYGEAKRAVNVPSFEIDRDPVTHADYEGFVRATGHRPPLYWRDGAPPTELLEHPVVGVDYFDALAYARWAGKDLPYEDEWERAARGTDGRTYPWGDDAEPWSNTARSAVKMTVPVGFHDANVSPDGCRDMVGNTWELTHSPAPGGGVVVRGGSWYDFVLYAKTFFRFAARVDARNGTIGFRCVRRSQPRPDAPRAVPESDVDAAVVARRGVVERVDPATWSAERRDLVVDLRRLKQATAQRDADRASAGASPARPAVRRAFSDSTSGAPLGSTATGSPRGSAAPPSIAAQGPAGASASTSNWGEPSTIPFSQRAPSTPLAMPPPPRVVFPASHPPVAVPDPTASRAPTLPPRELPRAPAPSPPPAAVRPPPSAMPPAPTPPRVAPPTAEPAKPATKPSEPVPRPSGPPPAPKPTVPEPSKPAPAPKPTEPPPRAPPAPLPPKPAAPEPVRPSPAPKPAEPVPKPSGPPMPPRPSVPEPARPSPAREPQTKPQGPPVPAPMQPQGATPAASPTPTVVPPPAPKPAPVAATPPAPPSPKVVEPPKPAAVPAPIAASEPAAPPALAKPVEAAKPPPVEKKPEPAPVAAAKAPVESKRDEPCPTAVAPAKGSVTAAAEIAAAQLDSRSAPGRAREAERAARTPSSPLRLALVTMGFLAASVLVVVGLVNASRGTSHTASDEEVAAKYGLPAATSAPGDEMAPRAVAFDGASVPFDRPVLLFFAKSAGDPTSELAVDVHRRLRGRAVTTILVTGTPDAGVKGDLPVLVDAKGLARGRWRVAREEAAAVLLVGGIEAMRVVPPESDDPLLLAQVAPLVKEAMRSIPDRPSSPPRPTR